MVAFLSTRVVIVDMFNFLFLPRPFLHCAASSSDIKITLAFILYGPHKTASGSVLVISIAIDASVLQFLIS